ncbi:MAG: CRTAC1 family protein [Saprospiraceae bacterium]|nr:CRTAC1 family protein [Saprospiraceae bacterium]
MNKLFPIVFIFIISLPFAKAQTSPIPHFTVLSGQAINNTPLDSRSVNIVDVNNDGWDDVFITNGPSGGQNNALYLNNGDLTFNPVSGDPIVSDNSPSDGATFADADNDGDIDGFMVTWYGQINYFYRNNGNSGFTHEPNIAMGNTGTHSETAAWGDYDNDGLVDLYLTNSDGDRRNMLYRNLGNGDFERITQGQWVTENDISRSVNWTDYDGDGDTDLYVTNESNQQNDLYRNDGNGDFVKVTGSAITQSATGSMSSSWGDIDNDGDLDLFVANAKYFQAQNNELFINEGGGVFSPVTEGSIVTDGGCSYGSNFGDYDNDGDLDLFVSNGYCNGVIKNFLYRNTGSGAFVRELIDITDLNTPCSFGNAWGDLNNDGWLDLVVATCKNNNNAPQPPNLVLINDGGSNHWLKIRLEGTLSNKAAIGAKVRVKAQINGQAVWQVREISAQSGYCGQNSLIAHFGLAQDAVADSIIAEFPSGTVRNFGPHAADTLIVIPEETVNSSGEITRPDPAVAMKVFPNPASQQMQITLQWKTALGGLPLRLTLTDSLGRQVWQEQLDTAGAANPLLLTIPLKGITPGIYALRAHWPGGQAAEKVSVVSVGE